MMGKLAYAGRKGLELRDVVEMHGAFCKCALTHWIFYQLLRNIEGAVFNMKEVTKINFPISSLVRLF